MSKVSTTTSSLSDKASDYESEIYDYAISALANLLPTINSVDSGSQDEINSILNSYTQSGMNDINDYYNSELYDLESDSASRFGNLDNSIYLDNLSNLSSERANAVSDFESDAASNANDLESDVIDKNYSYADLLTSIINDYYDNSTSLADIYKILNSSDDSSSSSSGSTSLSTVKSIVSSLSSLL